MSPKPSEALQFTSLLESIEHNEIYAIVGLDRAGLITCWNRGAELITQYSRPEALGKEVCLFFTESDKEHGVHKQELKQALQEGKAEDVRWHLRKDGSCFWASGALTAVRNEAGEVLGFCKIFRDDTARKRTEEQIHITNSELTRFAHVAAHDLQQPIRTAASYIQLAMKKAVVVAEPQVREYLQIAFDAAVRMRKLTGDLLAYAEAGNAHRPTEVVDCNTAFDMATENLKLATTEVEGMILRGALPEVKGIATQISQVFQNLLANAIKYRSPGQPPRIFCDAARRGDEWEFRVTDNGIGIQSKDKDRIFGAFERATVDTVSPGSGLGLAIVKKIIDGHGGRVWVESEFGKGARFYFTLPAKTGEAPHASD